MALSRRSGRRFEANIWPGFVDAMTALLLVLIFIISIFMIVQFMLSERIETQNSELGKLSESLNILALQLGLEQQRGTNLEADLTAMSLVLEQKRKEAEETLTLLAATNSVNEDLNLRLVAALTNLKEEKSISLTKETELSEKLVNLLAEKIALEKGVSLKLTDIQRQEILLSEAKVRLQGEKEINIESKLLVESLNQQLAEVRGQLGQLQSLLDASEAKDASEDVEIKNLSSKLNAALARVASEQRKNSRELTAQNTKLKALAIERDNALTMQRKNSSELEAQNTKLKAMAIERDNALTVLKDEKIKLAGFQDKESKRLNSEARLLKERNIVLQTITKERNNALEKLTKEKQLLAELKKKERERLEAEAKELKKYQSKFFAEVEKALGDQEGIKIKGDRFIFSSEILFGKGEANISKEGLNQIKLVSDIITSISKRIPADINWILRVDGHTDNVPLIGKGLFKDNWELSQARALSVVRYMSEELDVPSSRLAATGFGEHQPFDPANTEEAMAKNRRIEIKLTER